MYKQTFQFLWHRLYEVSISWRNSIWTARIQPAGVAVHPPTEALGDQLAMPTTKVPISDNLEHLGIDVELSRVL